VVFIDCRQANLGFFVYRKMFRLKTKAIGCSKGKTMCLCGP
jgi:hypothetical protein